MAPVLILQLLTLWPLCHTDSTPSVPPASYPKPWLGAWPATVVTPGVNVTLRCRAPQPAWRFALFKSGETDPLLLREVSSELAEFFLEEVTPAQGGSYHCCYGKPDWGPSVWSQPSDALELLVTGEVLGSQRRRGFVLYRGDVAAPLQYRDSAQPWADFPLPGARAPGTYSCYYHTPSAPYVLSPRSPVLTVRAQGEGPASRPSPPPSDPGVQTPLPPPSDPGAQAPVLLPQTQDPPPSDPGV
uniref:Osteoclast associated Ig-like receptor n=1 Tax=Saimiri boliviensis boliviensis TaxID=39432 RepID=A0A2K6SYF3_SAIBB